MSIVDTKDENIAGSQHDGKPMLAAGAGMGEGYYRINGKKILYWDGDKWMKPAKDNMGNYGVWLNPLEKQPRIKTAEYVPEMNKAG